MDILYPIYKPTLTNSEKENVIKAVNSEWISSCGEFIEQFEESFARYCGSKYAISTSNGTTALHLALHASEITEKCEVIVPDFTFIATVNAVCYTGAIPVFCDIEKDTLCINPDEIRKKINKNTKAIIPVHIYGHPANMDEIIEIAKEYNLLVIEDCAESHGAKILNQKVGTFGDCGVFSFYGNKIITTGEGGMITTDNYELYKKLRHQKDHAMSKEKKYWHDEIGFNYRMTNIQAAIGVAQLDRIDSIIDKKRNIFNWYKEFLGDVTEIKLNSERSDYTNVYWMICLEINDFDEQKRDGFMIQLREKGVDSRPYFYPISHMQMYEKYKTNMPITNSIFCKGTLLPSYFDLQKQDVEFICNTIKNILSK